MCQFTDRFYSAVRTLAGNGRVKKRLLSAWLENLTSLSRSSLRHAVTAARRSFEETALQALEAVERAYLQELMRSDDAREGLEAFLEKRPPQWRHR